MSTNRNAVKTGAYVRSGFLPWESPAEYEKYGAGIFHELQPKGILEEGIVNDVVANRWQRRRVRVFATMAAYLHPMGQALERAGAKSWADVVELLRKDNLRHKKRLDEIGSAVTRLAERAVQWGPKSEELEDLAHEIVSKCSDYEEPLVRIGKALDRELEFLEECVSKKLDRAILLENSLDAQFDKLLGRLQRVQEGRIMLENLRAKELPTLNSIEKMLHDSVDKAQSQLHDGIDGAVVKKAADEGGDQPVDLDVDDADEEGDDPLAAFAAEGEDVTTGCSDPEVPQKS